MKRESCTRCTEIGFSVLKREEEKPLRQEQSFTQYIDEAVATWFFGGFVFKRN